MTLRDRSSSCHPPVGLRKVTGRITETIAGAGEKDVIVKVKSLRRRLRDGMPSHLGENFPTELEGISKVLAPTLVRLVIPLTPQFLLP